MQPLASLGGPVQVNQFPLPVSHPHRVGRLEVAVDEIFLVQMSEGRDQRLEYPLAGT